MLFIDKLLKTFFKSEEDRKKLQKVVAPSIILHIAAAMLGPALMFILTRNLGAHQYGVFIFSFTLAVLLASLCINAFNILTVREVPALLAQGKMELWKGYYKWSFRLVLIISITVTLLSMLVIYLLAFPLGILHKKNLAIAILLAFSAIPFIALLNYFSALLRGQHKIVLSLYPDNIFKPIIFIILILSALVISRPLNFKTAILLNSFSIFMGALIVIGIFHKTSNFKGIQTSMDSEKWSIVLKSFFIVSFANVIRGKTDILMLGFLKDPSEVGIYKSADTVASYVVFFLGLMNTITAPSISRLNARHEKQKLQKMITKTIRGVMAVSLPAAIIFISFSKWIMLFWGPDFIRGQNALIILCVAHLFSIAFGQVNNVALMTGYQKYSIIYTSIAILINVGLNLFLTPSMGLNGTAIAVAVSIIFWNTGMFYTIKKKTGIRTWIFG